MIKKLYSLILLLALVQFAFSQNTTAPPSNWTTLNATDVDKNSTIQRALRFGIGRVITRGIADGDVPVSVYNVTGIYIVQKQDSNGTNYRFELQVTNAQAAIFRAKYDVRVAVGGEQSVLIARISSQNDVRWDRTLRLGNFTVLPKRVYVPQAAEIWHPIDSDELDANETVQDALKTGVNVTISRAVQNRSMPNSDYDVTGIYAVLKEASELTHYRFDVQVGSEEGLLFRTKCDVEIDGVTGRQDVYRWVATAEGNSTNSTRSEFGDYDFLPEDVYTSA